MRQLIATLTAHGIAHRLSGGRLYAENVYVLDGAIQRTWHDVTGYTTTQLYRWLGY